jgi:hypothetical protein
MAPHELDLNRLKQLMRAAGATQLFLKRLAENDNSKNQVYLGPDLTALNVLPNGPLAADPTKPALLKSPVHFSWLTLSGNVLRAPNAQLILYPQYPEVRFSGFLKGCSDPPSDVMTVRQGGRILFFGITASGQVLGFAAAHNSALAGEIEALGLEPDNGVFSRIPVEVRTDDRQLLLSELARISRLGWIDSKRLNSGGEILPCVATNCGGLTLEAELGVRPNSLTDPDFHGWEIKQYGVKNLARLTSGGAITLMTPEPTGGVYVADGIHEFIRRFGYPDRKIDDRRNFGGVHTAVKICAKTNLTLTLEGYNLAKHTITDFTKGISLLDQNGEAAATWHYKDLLGHWTRKHALAAYVPSINRKTMLKQYQYGTRVRLAEGTEFRLFLNAVASGAVYYDPGIKIVNVSGVHPEVKKRSQFRIKSSAIPQLYTSVTEVDVSA